MSPKDQTSEGYAGEDAMSDETESKKPKRLGRGLNALFGEAANAKDETPLPDSAAGASTKKVPLAHLHPSSLQPRTVFSEDAITELAASIAEKGVLQPLLVRASSQTDGHFEIIAGERRWRASQQAGIHEVPVVVSSFSDKDVLEVALIENLQREDLSPMEEARGYQRLMEEFGLKADELGQRVGKSRSHVSNTLRLMKLPQPVQDLVETGALSAGHARAVINADDPVALAKRVVAKDLSVRATEKLAAQAGVTVRKPVKAKDSDTAQLERELSAELGLTVDIKHGAKGGAITLKYSSLDQLEDVIAKLRAGRATKARDDDTLDLEEIIAKRGD